MPRSLEEWLIWLALFVVTPMIALISVVLMYAPGQARGWKAHALASLLILLGFGWSFMWFWFLYVVGLD